MKNILFLSLFALLAFTSCTHKSTVLSTSGDYMIIGPGGGFRASPIGTYYYLSSSQLLADTTVNTITPPATLSGYNFNTTLSAAKLAAMGNLLNEIPSSILPLNHSEIGNSMVAVDGGYTVVQARIGSTLYDWKFHADQSTSSAEIQAFVAKVEKVFE